MSVVSRASRVRRRALLLLGVVLVGTLAASAVAHQHLFGQLTRIEGAFAGLTHRPAGPGDGSLTVLLIGADQRPATGASGRGWLPGAGASAVLVVHLASDRVSARVTSVPLDTVVPGRAGRPVVSVVSDGPAAAVAAVEDLTGARVDHLAVLDWSVLSRLPGASRPLTGPVADATARAAADQSYLRAVAEDSLHTELRKQPWTLYHLADLIAGALAIDDQWSSFSLARLVVSMRNLRSSDISFVVAASTAPLRSADYAPFPRSGARPLLPPHLLDRTPDAQRPAPLAPYVVARVAGPGRRRAAGAGRRGADPGRHRPVRTRMQQSLLREQQAGLSALGVGRLPRRRARDAAGVFDLGQRRPARGLQD